MGSILDPGRPPKMDKAAILGDAARLVTQLRNEAQKLKDSNETLQEKINELKVSLLVSILVHFLWLPLYTISVSCVLASENCKETESP